MTRTTLADLRLMVDCLRRRALEAKSPPEEIAFLERMDAELVAEMQCTPATPPAERAAC